MKGRKHSWWDEVERILKIDSGVNINYYLPQKDDAPDLLTTDEMFKTETMILQDLASEKSCIVAGRSGFHVFCEHPNHLSILIQASMEYRMDRVARKQNITEEEARKIIDKVDKMRENYVKKYTGTSRYDTRNYQLVISADGKTQEQIADIIMEYIG
jgi:cytidylate kinase